MAKPQSHCPSCGYTKRDAQIQGDHRLCTNAGNAPWEKKSKPSRVEKEVVELERIKVTEKELKQAIIELNRVVIKHCKGSALRGLDVTSAAFACVLDIYSHPNEENPEGMCDDPIAFRKIFADFIVSGPPIHEQRS